MSSTPSAHDTAVGGEPVADTFPPSDEDFVYQGHPTFIIAIVISAL